MNQETQLSLEKLRRDLYEEMKSYNTAIEEKASEEMQSSIRLRMLRLQQDIRELTLKNGYSDGQID